MKKLLVVALALVLLCGAAVADWATDFSAWTGLSETDRFLSGEGRNAGMLLVRAASSSQLASLEALLTPIVRDTKRSVAIRGNAADRLSETHAEQLASAANTDAAKAAWDKIQALAAIQVNKPFYSIHHVAGLRWLMNNGPIAIKAGVLKEQQATKIVQDYADTLSMHSLLLLSNALQERLLPASRVVTFAVDNGQAPETSYMKNALTYLARAHAADKITDQQYVQVLRKVLSLATDRWKNMPEGEERDALLVAIGGVKTVRNEFRAAR